MTTQNPASVEIEKWPWICFFQIFWLRVRIRFEGKTQNRFRAPVSNEISDLRKFWLHAMCACTE